MTGTTIFPKKCMRMHWKAIWSSLPQCGGYGECGCHPGDGRGTESKQKITVLPPEALEKAHTYVELNFGKTYLSELEEKRINRRMCRDIHSDCSLYFTEGILKSPVKRNYQYEYAKRLKNKNIWLYHDKHRIVKRNIALLTEMLKKVTGHQKVKIRRFFQTEE